ncbi:MAG: GldM family protein [Bacteroidota bacterium]
MKTSIKLLLIAFLFTPIFVFGQSNSKDLLSVSATKMNVLYIGLDNPLDIAICNVKPETISVSIDNGEIVKVEGIHWIAKVNTPGKTSLKVFVEKDGKKELYGVREFRIMKIPDPEVIISNKHSESQIEIQKIIEAPYLVVALQDFLFDNVKFEVTSFKFSVALGEKIIEINCKGNQLTPEVIKIIGELKAGAKIYFEDIKAKGPDGTIRNLASAIYTIR